ncbi:hypothetical protein F8388_005371 [Cannabis sativa]|nr:hypothetical protein F8388_005371 [Cannabis sativa]
MRLPAYHHSTENLRPLRHRESLTAHFVEHHKSKTELPGDYGFDPLGLGKDPAFLKWYKEAELIHGRWAMAAVLGIFVGQAWSESKRWVDFFNPESQSVEWATPWSRTAENFANATGDQGYPSGKFFDPLGPAGTLQNGEYIPDVEKLERLKLAEIKKSTWYNLAEKNE